MGAAKFKHIESGKIVEVLGGDVDSENPQETISYRDPRYGHVSMPLKKFLAAHEEAPTANDVNVPVVPLAPPAAGPVPDPATTPPRVASPVVDREDVEDAIRLHVAKLLGGIRELGDRIVAELRAIWEPAKTDAGPPAAPKSDPEATRVVSPAAVEGEKKP